ncbi:GNAT family N-acetyltransferase [Streptomyces yaizuensis]|uniref:GNAT family N-acetyltransferase n=1 Tax=Streptomyces yaizuensis TaxID=2989713 RepID=A0ABQ5NTH1_9ACTN|nr:GNAT family N-acetyltransferase [Streptomyces sp. YSPA8]GLF93306.1 GNAT family N-acetyltransferase [Streptomyces sp. YSPA8]
MSVFLETERLTLRAVTGADLDHVFALDSDPEVMRYLNGGRPTTRETVRDTVLPRLARVVPCTGRPGFWAAGERATGAFLGWFEFRPVRDDDATVVELGYRLNKAAWGRGYATEGARALIAGEFAEPGAERVFATTMAVNTRSRRVMEKTGLRYVRTFFGDWPDRIEGSEYGEVEYALTREEWRRGTEEAG